MAAERLSVNLPTALRRDPSHAAELLVLYALGYLAPRLGRRRHPGRRATVAQVTAAAVRATRRAGALTGTSFVVGMPAALLSIYLQQLRMVLDISQLSGRDPTDQRSYSSEDSTTASNASDWPWPGCGWAGPTPGSGWPSTRGPLSPPNCNGRGWSPSA